MCIRDRYRNILSCDRVVRTCGTKDGLVGYELEGKKFGVVGTGAIGMRVAKIAQAFGCEVLAYSLSLIHISAFGADSSPSFSSVRSVRYS